MRPDWFRLGRTRARAASAAGVAAVDPPIPATVQAGQTAIRRQRRAFQALDDLLQQSEEDRRTWFAATAEVDPTLATEVASLLRADEDAHDLLPTRPPELALDANKPPERIGPYRLVERLGAGGMGEVFLGLRDDGLFQQAVAIKIIRPGLFSPQLAERFAEERRILASLQHPHIAQLFDGGADASGLSFIVMEYLHGRSITDFVQAKTASIDEILSLFEDVCSAVQFAHQNLVVHADIKPSNIVVTEKSGVKLVDFGISRFVDPADGAATSAEHPEPLTRAYAAPERRAGFPPSVSSDIYALGALLFELLVGQLPQALTETESAPGPDTLPAVIPLRSPSETLRGAAPGKVRPGDLAGDLDAIVLKALAVEPAQRYASVVELADDIDRYRRHLPVRAREDTWSYRTTKFIVRHRLGLALTTTAMVLVLAAATGIGLLYVESERARALADRRFGETRNMANYMITEVDPQLARLPGALPLRKAMVSQSHAYLRALEADKLASPALRLEVAKGYLRLAQIYGLDINGGTGDFKAAKASLNKARTILAELQRELPGDPQLTLALADADLVAANEIFAAPGAKAIEEALPLLDRARRGYDAFLTSHPESVDASLARWRAELMTGRLFSYLERYKEAVAIADRNLRIVRPAPQTERQKLEADYLLTASYLVMAEGSEELGDRDRALVNFTKLDETTDALRARGAAGIANDLIQSTAKTGRGRVLASRGQYDQSVEQFKGAIDLMSRILTFGRNDTVAQNLLFARSQMANVLSQAGRPEEARSVIADVVASTRAELAKDPASQSMQRLLAIHLGSAAIIEHRAGKTPRACGATEKAWEQWEAVRRAGGLLDMDSADDGPIASLKRQRAACGLTT